VQYSYAHTLSGGEKRRLFLLTVLMKNPNFLILDEPTNDLDIVTLQTLEDFLEEFKGCVLIVSHDRYFIDRLVDHTFVLEGDGAIKDYPGNYTEYRNWKSNQKDEEKESIKEQALLDENFAKADKKKITEQELLSIAKASEAKTTIGKKLSYKTQRELAELENEIPKLEEMKIQLELRLASQKTDFEEVQKLSGELKLLVNLLDTKSIRWLEIQEELQAS
jgi:ATP-binding cassette subfamily F protein uup